MGKITNKKISFRVMRDMCYNSQDENAGIYSFWGNYVVCDGCASARGVDTGGQEFLEGTKFSNGV